MLFNSFVFVFFFLPAVLIVFHSFRIQGYVRVAIACLVVASFIFYAYWNPVYLGLLVGSIVVNYYIGEKIFSLYGGAKGKWLVIVGVSLNLLLLGYFKYTDFLIGNIDYLFGLSMQPQGIILPLAISFFTFQQIAYLIDCYRGLAVERRFMDYCLFVSFFPQLIAGPIVHHKEMMPQFSSVSADRGWNNDLKFGLTLFIVGLFKKVFIADNLAIYASTLFDGEGGKELHVGDAWVGAIAYHFQIYFDFSGYSDMAIGLARMFGVALPVNFNSPYKAVSIVDFWRRWHMTLSRFLKEYLYIGLGGNRKGKARRYVNLMLTMFLGGLWHGASWTFVVWGGLHGFYLVANHLFRSVKKGLGIDGVDCSLAYRFLALWGTTLLVVIAWVYFRSPNIETANSVILAMAGYGEGGLSDRFENVIANKSFGALWYLVLPQGVPQWLFVIAVVAVLQAVVLLLPNSTQSNSLEKFAESYGMGRVIFGGALGLMLGVSIMGMFGFSEFIYFQF